MRFKLLFFSCIQFQQKLLGSILQRLLFPLEKRNVLLGAVYGAIGGALLYLLVLEPHFALKECAPYGKLDLNSDLPLVLFTRDERIQSGVPYNASTQELTNYQNCPKTLLVSYASSSYVDRLINLIGSIQYYSPNLPILVNILDKNGDNNPTAFLILPSEGEDDTTRVRIWRVLASGEEHSLKQLGAAVGERGLGDLKVHLQHVEKQAKTLKNKNEKWRERRGLPTTNVKAVNKLRIKLRRGNKNEVFIRLANRR